MALSLLLLVHGRRGGEIPALLHSLAAELQERRAAPVALQALTGPPPPLAPLRTPAAGALLLVPLLLLPGSHVRLDLPAIAARWRCSGALRRLPFLGAWPAWQRALAGELAELAGAAEGPPWLLHHPLEGMLAGRYLGLLERRCGCRCVAAPYSATDPDDATLPPLPAGAAPVLPLALAANRLCERLQRAPLLERPRLRQTLLRELERLP